MRRRSHSNDSISMIQEKRKRLTNIHRPEHRTNHRPFPIRIPS